MDSKKHVTTTLESLPQDLLGLIVSKIGSSSPEAYVNCISSCKELGATTKDERVCKSLNLTPLVKHPLASIKYPTVMNRCLSNNNPDAHYIKGIVRYFHLNHSNAGLHHLSKAADEGHKEAIYLYAILLLCTGMFEEGKNIWDSSNGMMTVTYLKSAGKKTKHHCTGSESSERDAILFRSRRCNPTTHAISLTWTPHV